MFSFGNKRGIKTKVKYFTTLTVSDSAKNKTVNENIENIIKIFSNEIPAFFL